MNIKQAKAILKRHNEWRRGGGGHMPHSTALLGQAIDVLLEAPEKQYGDIATELRDAAINWPNFISDAAGDIAACFCFADNEKIYGDYARQNYAFIHRGLVNPYFEDHQILARTFLLFVAEAITW
jgi:hypothetical protein